MPCQAVSADSFREVNKLWGRGYGTTAAALSRVPASQSTDSNRFNHLFRASRTMTPERQQAAFVSPTATKEAAPPTTLYGLCKDGEAGEFHVHESVDVVQVQAAGAGALLTAGQEAIITALVWCNSADGSQAYQHDFIDFYYSNGTSSPPVWRYITGSTQSCPSPGSHNFTAAYTIPSGAARLQAIRVQMRYAPDDPPLVPGESGSPPAPDPCVAGEYNDRDDLVFAVEPAAAVDEIPASSSSTGLSLEQLLIIGIVSGVLLLCCLRSGWFFWRKRQRQRTLVEPVPPNDGLDGPGKDAPPPEDTETGKHRDMEQWWPASRADLKGDSASSFHAPGADPLSNSSRRDLLRRLAKSSASSIGSDRSPRVPPAAEQSAEPLGSVPEAGNTSKVAAIKSEKANSFQSPPLSPRLVGLSVSMGARYSNTDLRTKNAGVVYKKRGMPSLPLDKL